MSIKLGNYFNSVIELSNLLKMRFIYRNPNIRNPIGQSLIRVIEYHNQGKYLQRDYEISKINMLLKHLKEIEKYDINLLNAFKKQIYRCGNSEYFGVRFEINITASLIRKNMKFIKSESPDFKIYGDDKKIFIECGSVHLSKPKSKDVKYKIYSTINEKSNKHYCNSTTALFIDVTNIYYNNQINRILVKKDEMKEYIKNALEYTQFGSVILFNYILNKNLNRFESVYIRIDNKNIDKTLLTFLNKCYPLNETVIYGFIISSES